VSPNEFGKFSTFGTKFTALGVCGGVPVAGQAKILAQGVDILVATPGMGTGDEQEKKRGRKVKRRRNEGR
jgi:superfamily II DNA/RNA helicase